MNIWVYLFSIITVRGSEVLLDGAPVNDRGVGSLIALIMLSFMDGELGQLATMFDLEGDLAPTPWRIRLVPRDVAMGSVLDDITLMGDELLREVIVAESSGTRTITTFTKIIQDNPASQNGDAGH